MTERTTPQYDFYATPPVGGAPPPTAAIPSQATPASTSSAPSAPVYGAPVNQFGTPIGTPGATLPAAYAPVQPARSGGVHVPRWVWRVVGPLVVLVVLGLFGVGKLGFLDVFHQPLEAPATLGGLPVAAEDGTVRTSLAGMLATIRSQADSAEEDVVLEVYSDEVSRAVMLLATRGEPDTTATEEFTASGMTVSTHGEVTCGVDTQRQNTTCARAGDGMTVLVIVVGTDLVAASAVATEAYDALG